MPLRPLYPPDWHISIVSLLVQKRYLTRRRRRRLSFNDGAVKMDVKVSRYIDADCFNALLYKHKC